MNKILKVLFCAIIIWFQIVPVTHASTWNFQVSLEQAVEPLQWKVNTPQPGDLWWGGNTLVNYLFNIIDKIVIPIAIAVWVIIGVIWWYKLLFSSDEKQISSWLKMVVFWVIWIIIMASAKYIGSVLFIDIFSKGDTMGIKWIALSQAIYNKIAYPFIKIALYLALAVIFVVLVWKSISLITKSDGTSHKKALAMIWRCALSILIIIWAKNIVEAIYWKQADVFDTNAQNLWDIGTWILADKNIPIVYNVISRALWIISLVIFILLLVQWFKLLVTPTKSENFQKLWKTLLYTVIWLFVIGIWYLIANAVILN